jgi:hypothetical protein
MLERGLRGMARSVRGALGDGPAIRPQQFTLEDRAQRRPRQRARGSEEQLERDTTPEEERPRRVVVPVAPSSTSSQGTVLRRELHNPASLRRAILLSEILDRPRALRPHRSD